MSLDQPMQRHQQLGHGTQLVGQRRKAEVYPFTGIAFSLAVQGLVLAELFKGDHGQQVRPRPTP